MLEKRPYRLENLFQSMIDVHHGSSSGQTTTNIFLLSIKIVQ